MRTLLPSTEGQWYCTMLAYVRMYVLLSVIQAGCFAMLAPTYHLANTGRGAKGPRGQDVPACRACSRIYTRPRRRARQPSQVLQQPAFTGSKSIRLKPITARPLQPFVMRESACSFLECKASGRRCIAADARRVDLGYQVAYCLGDRHSACAEFRSATNANGTRRSRRIIYTALAFIMIALVAAAFVQATGLSPGGEIGRAVGLS